MAKLIFNKDRKYFSIYTFNVLDYPENIMNAAEIIEKAFAVKITVNKTPGSFFHKCLWLVDHVKKRFRNFAAESIVALSVYISKDTDKRIRDRLNDDKAFKVTFISYQFGANMPTIADINSLLNSV